MTKLLSALVGVSMLGAVGAAGAAEPTTLTVEEMDDVTAGYTYTPQKYNYANNYQTNGAPNLNAQNVNNSNVQFQF
jgi:hypothetical protein